MVEVTNNDLARMLRREGRFSLSTALTTMGVALIALTVSLVNLYMDSESPGFPEVWVQLLLWLGIGLWVVGVFVLGYSVSETLHMKRGSLRPSGRRAVQPADGVVIVTPRMPLSQVRGIQSRLGQELERLESWQEVKLAWLKSGPYVLLATVTTAVVTLVAVWSNQEYSESGAAQWAPIVPFSFAVVVLAFMAWTLQSVRTTNTDVAEVDRAIRINQRYEDLLESSARGGYRTFVATKPIGILSLSHLRPISDQEVNADDGSRFSRFVPPWKEKIPSNVFDGMRVIDSTLMQMIEEFESKYLDIIRAYDRYFTLMRSTVIGLGDPTGTKVTPQSIGWKMLAVYRLQSGEVEVPDAVQSGVTYTGLGDEDTYISMLVEPSSRSKYSFLWTESEGIVIAEEIKVLVDDAKSNALNLIKQIGEMTG